MQFFCEICCEGAIEATLCEALDGSYAVKDVPPAARERCSPAAGSAAWSLPAAWPPTASRPPCPHPCGASQGTINH
jgi:hypothetical protein